jgi:hypothetical protein
MRAPPVFHEGKQSILCSSGIDSSVVYDICNVYDRDLLTPYAACLERVEDTFQDFKKYLVSMERQAACFWKSVVSSTILYCLLANSPCSIILNFFNVRHIKGT